MISNRVPLETVRTTMRFNRLISRFSLLTSILINAVVCDGWIAVAPTSRTVLHRLWGAFSKPRRQVNKPMMTARVRDTPRSSEKLILPPPLREVRCCRCQPGRQRERLDLAHSGRHLVTLLDQPAGLGDQQRIKVHGGSGLDVQRIGFNTDDPTALEVDPVAFIVVDATSPSSSSLIRYRRPDATTTAA
ncbi:hypothetical protein [Pseudomonas sp. UV AK001]|uniref:hypothetical protein n=1 Tax=Pseudomonas sp. UV AK001 TaxID=3384791 RepID=UPI0038D36002